MGSENERGQYFAENGVPGFVSPKTYKQIWEVYQGHLVKTLNSNLPDVWQNKTAYELHIELSKRPEYIHFYNMAAMAHFNHIFWDSISQSKTTIPDGLLKAIENQFSSLDQLKSQMLETGNSMFGNGFVWLLKDKKTGIAGTGASGKLRILCTYNAGSPYAEAWRMKQEGPTNRVGIDRYAHASDSYGGVSTNTLDGVPILCLNVWQHMWVPDYGMLGKPRYLSAWWERIDWSKAYDKWNAAAQR